MDELKIIFYTDTSVLVINGRDLSTNNNGDVLAIISVKINLETKQIEGPDTINHFYSTNKWNRVEPEKEIIYLNLLNSKFTDEEILKKIMLPLVR